MNFLAHLFLSGDNEEVLVGNLLEDFVVGRIEHPRNNNYSANMKSGILMHRQIDTFTDTHSAISNCKTVLYSKYHKYASVVVDIFFDHYLARQWSSYSSEPFDAFRKRVHQAFLNYWEVLPEKMKPMIGSMIEYDWLKNYGEFWGIERSLSGVAKRTTYESGIEHAAEDLRLNYDFFDGHFKVFFPLLVEHCTEFLTDRNFPHQYIIVK